MKTSVVLSAYNGEKFILEQLESIRLQTVSVDEVIILDDCSTDNTAKICQSFIDKHNLFHWHFEVNAQNKGFVQNFYDGFKKATGEIIFICDQDDIWQPNKVERMKYFFNNYPDAVSICSAYSRFYKDTILDKHVKILNRKKKSIKKINFNEFCLFYGYLGMATAFKKEILQYHYKECITTITYDISVNLIAVLQNGLYYVDEVLVNRRSYPESTSNKIATEWKNRQFNGNPLLYNIHRQNLNLKAFKNFISNYYENMEYIKIANRYLQINEKRFRYIENKSFLQWLLCLNEFVKTYPIRKYITDALSFLR